jgi:hypothetical protein
VDDRLLEALPDLPAIERDRPASSWKQIGDAGELLRVIRRRHQGDHRNALSERKDRGVIAAGDNDAAA